MEDRDALYDQVVNERDALLAHNQALIEELNALKSQSKRQSIVMKEQVEIVKEQLEADKVYSQEITQKADESADRVELL